jgi:HlyD family secretion protein
VGAPLFALDTVTTDSETQRAQAQVTQAQAQAADLEAARQRQAEVDVWHAQERSAAAQLAKAQRDYDRESQLVGEGISSRAQVDAARAARDSAQAALDQARAQVRAGEMSAGRAEQIRAAQAGVTGAQAALRGQQQRRADIAPTSPAAGMIEQTFFNPGEWVPANVPVVAVLPDDKRKLRFYVPEDRVASLRMGSTVRFTCDGCGAARDAKVSYISPRAEFTPPVIYSERARAKLVFLVEAVPAPTAQPLPPGLPVEVQAP